MRDIFETIGTLFTIFIVPNGVTATLVTLKLLNVIQLSWVLAFLPTIIAVVGYIAIAIIVCWVVKVISDAQ